VLLSVVTATHGAQGEIPMLPFDLEGETDWEMGRSFVWKAFEEPALFMKLHRKMPKLLAFSHDET